MTGPKVKAWGSTPRLLWEELESYIKGYELQVGKELRKVIQSLFSVTRGKHKCIALKFPY